MGVFLLAVVLSFLPAFGYAWVVYWLDRYEKEPRLLLGGVFIWGAFVATVGALILSLLLQFGVVAITGSEELAEFAGSSVIAPLVEESLKGIAVLLVFLIFRSEFDSFLDGIVYASITALGFAATENVLYLYFMGFEDGGMSGMLLLFFVRVILGGWNHAVYTAFIGIGLAVARHTHNTLLKFSAPVIGWFIGVSVHGIHNTMAVVLGGAFGLGGLAATILVDWIGWLIIFIVILWAISREKRWLTQYLTEEVDQGIITQEQYQVACSSWARTRAHLKAMFDGRYKKTWQLYQLCGELAQKKHQLANMGEEQRNSAIVDELRTELRNVAKMT
jgi:RsiW-degrading membrane proteinase PrsW (M82 family)